MKIQESGEMYLENILVLSQKQEKVRAIDIVNLTGYSKPSISRALSLLREEGMVTVGEDGAIRLTEIGQQVARKIYERHRLLTEFFVSIGVQRETASVDACRIEHVISDETFEKMKDCLKKRKKEKEKNDGAETV